MAEIIKFPSRLSVETKKILEFIWDQLNKGDFPDEMITFISSRMSTYFDFLNTTFNFQHENHNFTGEQLLFIQEQLRNYFNAIALERLQSEIYFYKNK